MAKSFEDIRHIRRFILQFITGLSIDQLNQVPEGFSNNITWNLAHLIAAQQGICYIRAGLKPVVEQHFYESFKSGTHPEHALNKKEIETIQELLLTTIDQFEQDYRNKVFEEYSPMVTRYGVALNNINDALLFLLFHEGFHLSYIMALKRLI